MYCPCPMGSWLSCSQRHRPAFARGGGGGGGGQDCVCRNPQGQGGREVFRSRVARSRMVMQKPLLVRCLFTQQPCAVTAPVLLQGRPGGMRMHAAYRRPCRHVCMRLLNHVWHAHRRP